MASSKKSVSLVTPFGEVPGRPAPDRSVLRGRVLAAAEAIVSREGLSALRIRDVAVAARCSVGSVYNAYADLDDLVVAVNRRTLLRLDARLEEACGGVDAGAVLGILAEAYLTFAIDETRALRALFEHRMHDGRPFPNEHLALVEAIFSRIGASLRAILPAMDPGGAAMLARTMFSSVHGVIMLGLEERLVAVPLDALGRQVAMFIATFLRGLRPR